MTPRYAALISLFCIPSCLFAQQAESAPSCFRGRPLPECGDFWITEVGYYWQGPGTRWRSQLGGPSANGPALGNHLSWELGYLVNRNQKAATGATIQLGTGEVGMRAAFSGRYRRWTSSQSYADFSAGVVRAIVLPEIARDIPGYGLTADLSLGWKDLAGVSLRGDLVRANNHTVGAVYSGVKVGSYPAVVATAVGVVLLAIVVYGFAHSDF